MYKYSRLSRIGGLLAITLCSFTSVSIAVSNEPFVVVAVDKVSEEAANGWRRDLWGKLLESLRKTNNDGILLRTFLDQPVLAPKDTDKNLVTAIKDNTVVLQAQITHQQASARPLSAKFQLPGDVPGLNLEGPLGWIPLPAFMEVAEDICFTDSELPRDGIPVLEKYQGHLVKSMYLCALEKASKSKIVLTPGSLCIGNDYWPLDAQFRLPMPKPLTVQPLQVSAREVINGRANALVSNHVLILQYTGKNAEPMHTDYGDMTAAEFFARASVSLWQQRERSSSKCGK